MRLFFLCSYYAGMSRDTTALCHLQPIVLQRDWEATEISRDNMYGEKESAGLKSYQPVSLTMKHLLGSLRRQTGATAELCTEREKCE